MGATSLSCSLSFAHFVHVLLLHIDDVSVTSSDDIIVVYLISFCHVPFFRVNHLNRRS